MKGLLLRLSSLDADAAAAVRVIAHFQALLGGTLDPAALVRSTAGLAECPAGLERADGRTCRFGPDGVALTGEPERVSDAVGLHPSGRVWLERPGGTGPFDALVLEWMAIAARTIGGPSPVADPALVELALSGREEITDRARALRLLGLAPELPLRVVAVADRPAADAEVTALALLGRGAVPGTIRVTRVGALGVALVQCGDGAGSLVSELRAVLCGTRAGVGGSTEALRAHESWEQARTALRFTAPGTPAEAVVGHDELGPLTLLAEIPVERLRDLPDVRALERLADGGAGAPGLAALAAFCRTGSLRQAAAELHLHHSSVAGRLARVEAALGLRLHDPQDRFRVQLALYAHRLATGGAVTGPAPGATR